MASAEKTTITVPVVTTEEVPAVSLVLTVEEASALATLLHCHIGGLQRSPQLRAVSEALAAVGGVNHNNGDLIMRADGGMTVLRDIFHTDWVR